jgi:hypothetical protein
MKIFVKESVGGGRGVMGGVVYMCFLEMGRWAKRFLFFLVLLRFSCGQDRMME